MHRHCLRFCRLIAALVTTAASMQADTPRYEDVAWDAGIHGTVTYGEASSNS